MNVQDNSLFRRIEICGGIASAKTTLAGLLSGPAYTPIFEDFEASPFLEAFYRDSVKYVFETEISFLLQHYHQIKKESIPDAVCVCDFSIILDLAYARMGLKGTKFDAFGAVFEEVRKEIGYPELLIHLKCDPKAELKRIRRRGREIEEPITIDFLEKLNAAAENEATAAEPRTKVISIDSSILDFANDEGAKGEVVRQIRRGLRAAHRIRRMATTR